MDLHERKLGKLPAIHDPRTLPLQRYATEDFSEFPSQRRWDTPIDNWGVMGNDQYGNCTFVTAFHKILNWKVNEHGLSAKPTDNEVIDFCRTQNALNGFNVLQRLKIWRKSGILGNRIWAYLSFNTADPANFKAVINAFGSADIGLAMPSGWRSQEIWGTGTGRAWRPGSWGLHSVPLVGYDADNFYCVTWGQIQPMTTAALLEYCDEAYAVLSPDWFSNDQLSPSGLDLPALCHDLHALTQ